MATSSSANYQLPVQLLLLLLLLPLMASASRFRTPLLTQNSEDSPFPPNFFFGTSSSSYQYEGAYLTDGKGLSNWDVFTHQPGTVLDGSNGDVATDQYHLYQEDADLLASLGVNSHKLSISWSRVLPKGRHGNINWKGINYYKNLIDSLLLKGIEPFVTINHYDLPQELQDRYQGWLSSEMQEEYAYFADICFKHLGDKVKYWITFNEPKMWIICAYRWGIWPPNRCSEPHGICSEGDAAKEPFIVAHNIILAHAAAVNIYRKNYQQQQGGQIGLAVLFYWYEPITNSTADKAAVERGQSFMSKWFLDPIIYGSYPKEMKDLLGSILPEFSSNDLEKLKAAGLDFIGINHYTTYYVQDCLYSTCDPFMLGNTREEGFVGQNGNLIGESTGLGYLVVYPLGMEKVVTYVKEKFPNVPLYVTENGYCDTTTPSSNIEEVLYDTKRVKFLVDYLDALGTAIRKGADVRGYFIWSLFDNFEWTYGYTKRLGLYQFDRATLKRTPKLSAKWYKQFIAKNQKVGNKMESKNLILHQNQ